MQQWGETDAKRASERLVAALEADIVSGALRDGAPLPPERDLMERFGASRTVVREAIAQLSNTGLLEVRPRFRPIVRKPDYKTVLQAAGNVVQHLLTDANGIRNLYESRVFIERALVREAALSASETDLAALDAALSENRDAIDNSAAFYQTDIALHGVLYDIPGNPVYPAVHAGFTAWLAPQWDRMPRSPERNAANYRAHVSIVQAIRDRDADTAETMLRAHLGAAWEQVRSTFAREP